MNVLIAIELIKNFFDVGVFFETLKNARKRKLQMDLKEFIGHLLWGKGYGGLTPPQLSEKIKTADFLIVDLREKSRFEEAHIETALSSPFDEFLKGVLVDETYADSLDKQFVLVCDTGHMSRVAAAIMAEEGFKSVFNLKGGMRRWNRWQKMLTHCKWLKHEKGALWGALCGVK